MTSLPRHEIVIGLGFGDEGKGAVVDALAADPAREPVGTVVRFNGGAQAAHNVVLPDGRHHTFAQFGSATLRGASTHLSRFMLVEPFALAAEGEALAALGVPAPLRRLAIDRRALLTTPWHAAANRAKEIARGDARHGSCGVGIGETMAFAVANPDLAPRAGDATDPARLRRRLAAVRDAAAPGIVAAGLVVPALEPVAEAFEAFGAAVRLVGDDFLAGVLRRERVVFEGAQGVLLDEWRAFHPYATWSTTTFANAHALLAEAGVAAGEARRVGVLRVYTTRHGAGPLPAEDDALTAALPEAHNGTGAWQGGFRAGHLDLVLHRYALQVAGGADLLALTHLDRGATPGLGVVDGYREAGGALIRRIVPGPFGDLDFQRALTGRVMAMTPLVTPPAATWPEIVEAGLGVPVGIRGFGPAASDYAMDAGSLPAGEEAA